MKRKVIKLISNFISWIDFTLEDNFQFKISRHVIFRLHKIEGNDALAFAPKAYGGGWSYSSTHSTSAIDGD